jgi:SAM-dependent MidA family methyltransferase
MKDFNQVLYEIVRRHILESPQQQITFAEYMDLLLYHPQQGYYATNQAQIGVKGDFFTSPHLGADFGELLAEQFVEMWEILGKPTPFHLVEMGAGQGLLATDILKYLYKNYLECFQSLDYIIIEKASALITEQKRILSQSPFIKDKVQWATWEEIPENSITGCFFSNELVDALPVHLICIQEGEFQEIYVTCNETELRETTGKLSTPALQNYFENIGINILNPQYQAGYRTEVNLAALDWIKTVATRLKTGYLLTIDYGYLAERYYSPFRREGTLQCYYQHSHHNNPYLYIGRQDITAHVDFTALERQGERWGLNSVGFIQQGLFLMALGLGERIAAISQGQTSDISGLLRRREALHQLINPMGLGNFGVLIQSKGLSETQQKQPLKGLSAPSL